MVRNILAFVVGFVLVAFVACAMSQGKPTWMERATILEKKGDGWEISYGNVHKYPNAHVIACFIIPHEHYAECFYVDDDQDVELIPQPLEEERT